MAQEAWRVAKQRVLHTCHHLVFKDLKALSFTGFFCTCADGVRRKIFPALHSYIADTPEHTKLACVMGWPAACYCCKMPRGDHTLDDLVRGRAWEFRTTAEVEDLQAQADAAGGAAARQNPADGLARLRAATKFCDSHGIRWGPTVLRRAGAERPAAVWHTRRTAALTFVLLLPFPQRLAPKRRPPRQPLPWPAPGPAPPRGQRRVAHAHRRLLRAPEERVPAQAHEAPPRGRRQPGR